MDLDLVAKNRKKFQVGDFIVFDGVQCVIKEIVSFGPFDPEPDYYLYNLDTGKTVITYLSELLKRCTALPEVDLNVTNWKDDDFVEFDENGTAKEFDIVADFNVGDLLQADDNKENVENKPDVGVRFKALSPDELDKIADANEEPATKKQTKWGVKLFRGNFIH